MAIYIDKSYYVAQQRLWWTAVFSFTLILAYAFLKDIIFSPDGFQSLTISKVFILGLFSAVSCFFASWFRIKSKKYGSGQKGESRVARELQNLTDEYTIFHGIQLPGYKSDIDFIVISPYEICTIEVKNHSYIQNVDMEKVVSQASREAYSLKRYIKKQFNADMFVRSVLVFSNPRIVIPAHITDSVNYKGIVEIISINQLTESVQNGYNKRHIVFDTSRLIHSLQKL